MTPWVYVAQQVSGCEPLDVQRLRKALNRPLPLFASTETGPGLFVFDYVDDLLYDAVASVSARGERLILGACRHAPKILSEQLWRLLAHGLTDVVPWRDDTELAAMAEARFARWEQIATTVGGLAEQGLVGASSAWRRAVSAVVEAALYTRASILITGESGTGKELLANAVHSLAFPDGKSAPVIVDCTTIVPELSGSELFGHERGAFTGAVGQRNGAFAEADGGTLVLDEVGELPPALQAQLLRVIQEGTYKRVGGNTWFRTTFRLVCATNRDLPAMVEAGTFRADLYYRLAGVMVRPPALRERREDIPALVARFMADHHVPTPQLEPAVEAYLLERDFPGNVRELRQVVSRMMYRWAGVGPVTVGCIPEAERGHMTEPTDLPAVFEQSIGLALRTGVGLKEIGRTAEDVAIRMATAETGSLSAAAKRLGVTDRALQIRRKAGRNGAAA